MKKIVIIGGGPAGLTAAYELLKDRSGEYDVTVLEAGSRLGGISATVRHGENRIDLGGHRLFSKDERIMNWWKEIMPVQGKPSIDDKLLKRSKPYIKGGPDPEKTDDVLLIRDRCSHICYKNRFYEYPVTLDSTTLRKMDPVTAAQVISSYLYSCVNKLPGSDLESFYINRFGKKLYSMFFESYTEKLWGVHPREISADWGAQRVKGLSVGAVFKDMLNKRLGTKTRSNTETSLIERFWYPKLGSGQLWENVGKRIISLGGKILFERKVTKLNTAGRRIVSVRCGDEEFFADEFISSMPVNELISALNVQGEIKRIADGLPYRDLVIIGLLVDRLKLKNETNKRTLSDIPPDNWIYVQDKNIKLGRVQIFNNWSPYIVKDPLNTVWIGAEYFCGHSDKIWSMNEEECAALAEKELRRIGIIGNAKIIDMHCEKVSKAYPAYYGTYNEFYKVKDFLNSFDDLWCIGRNGQHRYNNMDHSMMTAIETVKAIKKGSTDKKAIWNVNTDKIYHEHK